ncbi:MAG: adenylate/guanylate cyclase domain-containing protein [Leptospiraceae bacterium]
MRSMHSLLFQRPANQNFVGSPFLLILLAFLLLATNCNPEPAVDPLAQDGFMQAQAYNISDSPLPLAGEWMFQWNEWVNPSSPPERTDSNLRKVKVPSHWTDYPSTASQPSHETTSASEEQPSVVSNRDPGLPVKGKASFWLRIQLDPNIDEISLRIPSMDTSFVLYWNGKEIARNGYLTDDLQGTKPVYYAPQQVRVPNQKENLLVIHMGNLVYPRPGLRDTILIGTEKLISGISSYSNYFAFFIIGALSLLTIYHLGIYAMRREDRSPLYFSLFCMIILVRLLVTGEGLAYRFWPINWNISTALEYLTFYLAPVPFLLFLRSLYPEERIRFADETIYAMSASYALFVLVAPIGLYTQSLASYQVVAALCVVYALGILTVAAIRGRDTARSFMVGALILIATLVNDILYSQRIIQSMFIFPAGVFLFFFSQAFLLSRRFAIAFRTAETLTLELDQKVKDRTKDLELARNRSDELLRNILPDSVAQELKEKGSVTPQYHPLVTVLFVDFVDFTRISERWHPSELVTELDACFSAFDEITQRNHLEKLKTIGDSYMAAAGIPLSRADHAFLACEAALEISSWMHSYQSRMEMARNPVWNFRIGMHSGPVTAGVIGTNKFAYDIWGDTVNTASRMERFAPPGQINISAATYEIVKERYNCETREKVEIPGKGLMQCYSLARKPV